MSKVEERVERLESLLGQFIVNTDVALRRLETSLEAFKDEMRAFKDEMRAFKDEMGVFKDEMRAFKDEMRSFKDEMRAFKDEVNEDRKRMNKMWGELANKMGTLVEDIVAPNIGGIASRYFGCEKLEDFMIRRMKRSVKDENKVREFDVIAVWDDKVIINETKSTPRMDYINEFIEVLKEITDYFPEYKDKEIIPIFSSLYLPDKVVEYLTKKKIYAMAMKDDTMDLLNFEEIKR